MRDDFKKPTKDELAKRVAYLCSSPDCRQLTIGPKTSSEDKSLCTGEAAHITAAAPGGPRYDSSLTNEERRSISNGIWLCSRCAKVIDTDEAVYPVKRLRKWKREAEEQTRLKAFTNEESIPVHNLPFRLDEESKAYLQALSGDITDDIEQTTLRVHAAAKENISTFMNTNWPEHRLSLNFMLAAEEDKPSITLEGIANGTIIDDVRVVSAPGTGKTISLIQLTNALLNIDQAIAVYIPLGEWAITSKEILEFLVHRNAFRSFKPQHFMQLAFYGRLVLVLDGWNELASDAQKRARKQLEMLKRDFPMLRIVIGTRRQASHPIWGTEVNIEPLSKKQQLQLAVEIKGAAGMALMEQAWAVSGIRELVGIPLYLTAFLTSTTESPFPETKEAILSNFIALLENDSDKADIFQHELLGCHRALLTGLAVEANKQATTSLSESRARVAITKTLTNLQETQQITNPSLQPPAVLTALVNAHVLIRTSSEDIQSYSFQHQQFQEWFASFEVEHFMLEAQQGDESTRKQLRSEVLNWLAWEESIFFTCERLSRRAPLDKTAVAEAILDALFIDPMLAAEMIYCSTDEVWSQIAECVMDFVKHWHTGGSIDQAIVFMVASGRPEFSEYIWPLITNSDRQIYMGVFPIAKPFRASVLGMDAEIRLLGLPEEQRKEIFSEFAYSGSYEAMELSVRLAQQEQSPLVIAKIVEALNFRQAGRYAEEILKVSSGEVWKLVVQDGYQGQFSDPALADKYRETYEVQLQSEQNPLALLNHELNSSSDFVEIEPRIVKLIQSDKFPIKNEYAQMVIGEAFQTCPKAVSHALVQRLAAGLYIPNRLAEILAHADPIDEDSILQLALDKNTPSSTARLVWTIVGPKTVSMLVDEYILLYDEYSSKGFRINEEEREEYFRLQDAITTSQLSSFLSAVLSIAESNATSHISLLAELIAKHGRESEHQPFILREQELVRLTKIIHDWVTLLLGSSNRNRSILCNVAVAIQRLPLAEFIPDLTAMLERDTSERAKAKEERTSDAAMNYINQYFQTFAVIKDNSVIELMKTYLADLRFGREAAGVLYTIWKRENAVVKDKRWADFSEATERRKQITVGQRPPMHELAAPIINVIRQCCSVEADSTRQLHALKLSEVAFNMPYGNQNEIIQMLLHLPQSYNAKRVLMTILAMQGEVLPSSMLFEAVQELQEQELKEPWRRPSGNDHDVPIDWLKLFVFSERPLALLDEIDQLPNQRRVYEHLDRLLPELVYCPSQTEALQILAGLLDRNSDIIYDGDWIDALLSIGTEAAVLMLVKAICGENFQMNRLRLRGYTLPTAIGKIVNHYPLLRNEILKKYQELPIGPIKACFESVLLEIPDMPSFLVILNNIAIAGRPFDYKLKSGLRKLALGEKISMDWPGHVEVHSVSLSELRKQLFARLSLGEPLSSLAKACLTEIEELREQYGRIEDEPRHPDIESSNSRQYYLF